MRYLTPAPRKSEHRPRPGTVGGPDVAVTFNIAAAYEGSGTLLPKVHLVTVQLPARPWWCFPERGGSRPTKMIGGVAWPWWFTEAGDPILDMRQPEPHVLNALADDVAAMIADMILDGTLELS